MIPGRAGTFGTHKGPLAITTNRALEPVLPVRFNLPPGRRFVPADVRHRGLEQAALIKRVSPGDGLGVTEDLWLEGVLLLGNVPELFQQRQVDVRLDVAHGARIAVPVPRAPHVPGPVDEPDIGEAPGLEAAAATRPPSPAPTTATSTSRCWDARSIGALYGSARKRAASAPDSDRAFRMA